MYFDVQHRRHKDWVFQSPDPTWYEATSRDELLSVYLPKAVRDKWDEGERKAAMSKGIDRWPMYYWIDSTPAEYRVTFQEMRSGKRSIAPQFADL